MGNTGSSSVVDENSNNSTSRISSDEVPPQSSISSSSSASSASEDPYSDDNLGDDPSYQKQHQQQLASSSAPSECYRIPFLFQRKSDPLKVFHDERATIIHSNSSIHSNSNSNSINNNNNNNSVNYGSIIMSPIKDHSNNDNDEKTLCTTSKKSFFSKCAPSNNNNSNNLVGTISGCVTAPLSKSSSWSNFVDASLLYTQEELDMPDGDQPTEQSNLNIPRKYWIVTTAALPWMTGTAVNPLLRAAYLASNNLSVTLVLPWLESPVDRLELYGEEWKDATQQDQDNYIRHWLKHSAQIQTDNPIHIQWYNARYHAGLSSIFAMGDLCQLIPVPTTTDNTDDTDTTTIPSTTKSICILEEPEHVNFYRAPGKLSWRDKFDHVIGIIHTNYKAYASSHYSGLVTGPLVGALSSFMVRAYCDKVIKLSPVLQAYALEKEVVCNVHGIRNEFFQNNTVTGNKVYFIGKLLWAKGLDKLLDLQALYKKKTGQYFPIDIYGSGPEQDDIKRAFLQPALFLSLLKSSTTVSSSGTATTNSGSFLRNAAAAATSNNTNTNNTNSRRSALLSEWRKQPIPAQFLGRKDHAAIGEEYKVFVNPSITEVLCTTTAESIAMGKWVIVPQHKSNEFFEQFPNCLQYSSKEEFVQYLQYALSEPPPPLHDLHPLTWQAATERFIQSASISKRDAKRRDRISGKFDEQLQKLHYALGRGYRGDVLRKVLGGGPVAEQYQYEQGV